MAEAQLSPILKSLSGELGNFIFRQTKNGPVVCNPGPARTGLPTQQQQLVQAILSTVTKAWKTASDAQRAAWEEYARTYFPHDKDGVGAGPSGQAVFTKANFYLQAAGQAVQLGAPTTPPPSPVSSMAIGAAADDELQLRLTVAHGISPVTNYRLLVEVTPPLVSAARKVDVGALRAVLGIAAGSYPALQASGQQYTFSPLRVALPDGIRFGVRGTIISPSGIPSTPVTVTLMQALV